MVLACIGLRMWLRYAPSSELEAVRSTEPDRMDAVADNGFTSTPDEGW